jgi:NAD-dependent DNA ligase
MTSILSLFNRACVPSGAFAGKTVAFTGALKSGGYAMERKEAQRIVREMGGKVITGESGKIRNTNLLVLGTIIDGAKTMQKRDRASEWHVQTITAAEFFGMITK